MPRKPRLQSSDVLYHVTTRGVEKRDIFSGALSYLAFLEILAQTVARYGWICHSYCLMKNHYHLAVETPQANISAGMQFLKGEHRHRSTRHTGVRGRCTSGAFATRSPPMSRTWRSSTDTSS